MLVEPNLSSRQNKNALYTFERTTLRARCDNSTHPFRKPAHKRKVILVLKEAKSKHVTLNFKYALFIVHINYGTFTLVNSQR